MSDQPILEIREVTKTFGGILALNRVSLLFRSNGGIHEEEIDIMVLRHQKMDGRVRKIPSLLDRDILNKYALSMSAKKNFVEIKEDLSL